METDTIIDYYYYIDKWPERAQDGFITGEDSMVGGCAINMAAAASSLGCPAYVISGLGEDQAAETAGKYMMEHALPTDLIERAGGTSGKRRRRLSGSRGTLSDKYQKRCYGPEPC